MSGDQEGLWRIADAVAWTTSENGVVALNLDVATGQPLMLQNTAGFVWEEIAASGPLSSAALIKNVAAAYELHEDRIRGDVIALLNSLLEQHLIAR